jgi:hypothetical protein
MRFLHDQGLRAEVISQHLVDVFGDMALAHFTITRTLRQVSWATPEMLKGRPANFSIDPVILCVLSRGPTASLGGIAE